MQAPPQCSEFYTKSLARVYRSPAPLATCRFHPRAQWPKSFPLGPPADEYPLPAPDSARVVQIKIDARRTALRASLPLTFSFSAPQSPSLLLSRPPAPPSSPQSRQQVPPSSPASLRPAELRQPPHPLPAPRAFSPSSPASLSAPLPVSLSSPHRHRTENASSPDPQSPRSTSARPQSVVHSTQKNRPRCLAPL